jgi:hypothetical protein
MAFHLIDDPRLIGDQFLPLAIGPPCVLFLNCWDRCHVAMTLLAAQPTEERADQQFRVEAIGLRTPTFT